MELFKKRSVALIVALVIVVGSTFISAGGSLNRACREITDGFYNGVVYDGYEHKSIASQLKNISSAALGLVTIAENHNVYAEPLKTAHDDLDSSLENGSVSDIYDRYAVLMQEASAVIAALEAASLSDRYAEGLSEYSSTIRGAQAVIAASGYNETVREFRSGTLTALPAAFFETITGAQAPELFE